MRYPISLLNKPFRTKTMRHYATVSHESSTLEDFYGTKIDPILAPVSSVTDIHGNTLKATAALRIGMHHLHGHADRFVPLENHSGLNIHCVSQACVTHPVDDLKGKLNRCDDHVTIGDFKVGVTPLISDMWVQSLGRTSITFGHVVSLRDELIALGTYVFVRQDKATGALIHITDDERTEQFPAIYEEVGLPPVEKFPAPNVAEMEELFQVQLGPQHCTELFADPAALAEIALQGLALRGFKQYSHQQVSFQHLQPAQMHQTISCRIHDRLPLIGLYRSFPSGEDELLVLATITSQSP